MKFPAGAPYVKYYCTVVFCLVDQIRYLDEFRCGLERETSHDMRHHAREHSWAKIVEIVPNSREISSL